MAIPYWIDRSSHGDAPIVELGPERDWAVVKLACDSMRQCIEGEIIEADMADDLAARIDDPTAEDRRSLARAHNRSVR